MLTNTVFLFQPTPTSRFVVGYVGAVSSAVSIAVSAIVCPFIIDLRIYLIKFSCVIVWPHCSCIKAYTSLESWNFVFFYCRTVFQVGLSALIKRANSLSPAMKILIQRFVPFPAVGTSVYPLILHSWSLFKRLVLWMRNSVVILTVTFQLQLALLM